MITMTDIILIALPGLVLFELLVIIMMAWVHTLVMDRVHGLEAENIRLRKRFGLLPPDPTVDIYQEP